MKRPTSSVRIVAPLMIFSALLAVRCSSSGDNAENGSGTMDQPANTMTNGSNTDQAGMDAATSSNMGLSSHTGSMNTDMTPEKERMLVFNDMEGLRGELLSDLDSVRNRLNDGTMPKDLHEADKAAAADLAQGLERVDRAIEVMDTTTNATWASIRDARVKEVADVRAWLTQYRANVSASASK